MDGIVKAEDILELISQARRLRGYANATNDLRYIDLFLTAAAALEDCASNWHGPRLYIGRTDKDDILQAPVSSV